MNLKLNTLANQNLDSKEMTAIRGGGTPGICGCACAYANSGGSSSSANGSANNASGLFSPGTFPEADWCPPEIPDGPWLVPPQPPGGYTL